MSDFEWPQGTSWRTGEPTDAMFLDREYNYMPLSLETCPVCFAHVDYSYTEEHKAWHKAAGV